MGMEDGTGLSGSRTGGRFSSLFYWRRQNNPELCWFRQIHEAVPGCETHQAPSEAAVRGASRDLGGTPWLIPRPHSQCRKRISGSLCPRCPGRLLQRYKSCLTDQRRRQVLLGSGSRNIHETNHLPVSYPREPATRPKSDINHEPAGGFRSGARTFRGGSLRGILRRETRNAKRKKRQNQSGPTGSSIISLTLSPAKMTVKDSP